MELSKNLEKLGGGEILKENKRLTTLVEKLE